MDRFLEYASRHPWLLGTAVLALGLALGYEFAARSRNFAAVTSQDLIRLMNQGALVLDLRKPEEFAAGHIGGAKHMAPDQILKANEVLKKHRDKPLVVYCETGSLAASAARQLVAQGFTKVRNLRGGLAGWRAENLPLAKG